MKNVFHAAVLAALCLGLAGCGSRPSATGALPPPAVLAQQAEQRGDWPAAAGHWEVAAAAAPNDRATLVATAHALRLANACGRASVYLQKLAAKPDYDVLMETGKCHLASGRYEAAETAFKAALADKPDSWETETVLGVNYDLMERPQDALVHHDRAVALAPLNPVVLSNKALSVALAGSLTDALSLMQKASARPDAPAKIRMNLAFLEALAGHGNVAELMARQELTDDDATVKLLQRIAASAK